VLCTFDPIGAKSRKFRCRVCGWQTPGEHAKPPRRNCSGDGSAGVVATPRAAKTRQPASLDCPHRGELLETLTDRRECGCGGTTGLEVWHCNLHAETVARSKPANAGKRRLENERDYRGRTCVACKLAGEDQRQIPPATATVENLAAVTAFYNFGKSANRLANYRRFAEHLDEQGIPLFTIEAALPGHPFEIEAGERVRQIAVRDPLWHKERLLNLLIESLPADFDAVAWIDADVLFPPGIAAKTIEALRRWPVVQMFDFCEWLDANGVRLPFGRWPTAIGMAWQNWRDSKQSANPSDRHPGMAWAARRETLRAIGGLYDRYPAGSGDVFSAAGFYGDFDCKYLAKHSKAAADDVRAWGRRAFEVVGGNVGFVQGLASHLFHGTLQDRQYHLRHDVLREHGFDPTRHQELIEGVYRFSKSCPAGIRDWLATYLLTMRNEDD